MLHGKNFYRHRYLEELMRVQLQTNDGRADHPISAEVLNRRVGNIKKSEQAYEFLWANESVRLIPASPETGNFDQVQFFDKGRKEYLREVYADKEAQRKQTIFKNALIFLLNLILALGVAREFHEYCNYAIPKYKAESRQVKLQEQQKSAANPSLLNQPAILESTSVKDTAIIRVLRHQP